jgi:hypothetical protein
MKHSSIIELQDNLSSLGFDVSLLAVQLFASLEGEADNFHIYTKDEFDNRTVVDLCLYFHKYDAKNICYLIKYEANLSFVGGSNPSRKQTFYICKGTGYNLREAYNLLSGRAVFKHLISLEGDKYSAWSQLDFNELDAHGNYRIRQFGRYNEYDLGKVLFLYPILEMDQEETKTGLIARLRQGDEVLVTFVKPTRKIRMFVSACPRYKTINIVPQASKHLKSQDEADNSDLN